MAFLSCCVVLSPFFIFVLFFIFVYNFQKRGSVLPTNWPIVGMIPGVLVNAHRLHDYVTGMLISSGGTFMFRGPCFANMDMLITTNPLNVHHVLSKNFSNYPKGEKFRKIFDIMGEGIFNSDNELWEIHRKVTMFVFNHAGFRSLLETILWDLVENGLLPVLEFNSRQGNEMDLQDIFQRFSFDTICKLLLDHDPKSLSLDYPYVPCFKAFSDAEEAILHRHVTPPSLWKLQKLFGVGNEKKMNDAWKTIDQFIYKCLNQKSNYFDDTCNELQSDKFLVLTAFMKEFKDQMGDIGDPTKFLRDTILSLMVAGKDSTSSTLSWFFYILAQNPTIEDRILQEIHTHMNVNLHERTNAKTLNEMVYLNGALNETMRLFPPLPFNHKSPLKPDILPSGHQVNQNTKIILSFYSMGRMKSIWGDDCMEFKPERWITKVGGMTHEPSYKFPAFNAGPRTCVGKDMALSQMRIVSVTIISRYHIELLKDQLVIPADSMVLQMKHGLKVRLVKRSEMNTNQIVSN